MPGAAAAAEAERLALVPVTSRSRSNSRATKKQAAQSITSSAPASAAARPDDGVITWNDISEMSASGGRLPSTLSCWATRVSVTFDEIARPTQIAHAASSGMNRTSAGSCGACHIAVATGASAKSARSPGRPRT